MKSGLTGPGHSGIILAKLRTPLYGVLRVQGHLNVFYD